jgi:hypothetical protein
MGLIRHLPFAVCLYLKIYDTVTVIPKRYLPVLPVLPADRRYTHYTVTGRARANRYLPIQPIHDETIVCPGGQ